MEWWIILLSIFAVLILVLLTGIPVAFAFIVLDAIGMYVFMGGEAGLHTLITSLRSSVSIFTLIPIPLFILMGDVLFRSGIATRILDIFDTWLVKLPGRLSLVAVSAGTLFAALSGSSLGTTAMLGSLLAPDMYKRGYQDAMVMGPIMAGGMLAVIIPPSILTVILGSLANVSVGKLLIAGIIPGLILASLYCAYIVTSCKLNPTLAPRAVEQDITFIQKLVVGFKGLLPAAIIILLVLGTIFAGVCTPTEAAALGALGCFILTAAYGKLHWSLIRESVLGCTKTTVMILIIVTGSMAFSQILSFTGATRGLVEFAASLPVSPILIAAVVVFVLLFLGCFIDQISMLMIAVPIFAPVAVTLKFDLIWFGTLMLLGISYGLITPPFGMLFFVIKGSMPIPVPMSEVYRSGIPFVILSFIGIILVFCFPVLATWLPGLMMGK